MVSTILYTLIYHVGDRLQFLHRMDGLLLQVFAYLSNKDFDFFGLPAFNASQETNESSSQELSQVNHVNGANLFLRTS